MISKSKSWALTLGVILILALQTASAQSKDSLQDKSPKQRAQMQTEWMKSKLGLNETQLQQVQAINLKYAERNEPILTSDARKLSKFKQLRSSQDDKDKELKKLFTSDQFKKYQNSKAELKEKVKEMGKNKNIKK